MRPSGTTAATRASGFGERIRQQREAQHLSQRELAQAIGGDKRAVNGWERGETGITWPKVDRVAEVLGCSGEWIVFGDEIAATPAGVAASAVVVDVLQRIDERLARMETMMRDHGESDDGSSDLVGDAVDEVAQDVSAAAAAESDSPNGRDSGDAADAPAGSRRARNAGTRRTGRRRAS